MSPTAGKRHEQDNEDKRAHDLGAKGYFDDPMQAIAEIAKNMANLAVGSEYLKCTPGSTFR
jgi:hypothetical protein